MKLIHRKLKTVIEKKLFKGKAILLIGARQVGKSTLFNQLIQGKDEEVLSLNCDEPDRKSVV